MDNNFKSIFLRNYLKFGLGSLSKSDIDALVMFLIDRFGLEDGEPLSKLNNQDVSERLKTPITKIRRLRYESALKFGEDVEKEAKVRLLHSLSHASIEIDKDNKEKIFLILEDVLARNWLLGQLKQHKRVYDSSFNTEIVKVSAESLFLVLETLFDKDKVNELKSAYDVAKQQGDSEARSKLFKQATNSFVEALANGLVDKVANTIMSGIVC